MFGFTQDLAIILKALDMPSRQLAKQLGFDEPTVCNWLNGKYEPDIRSKEDIYSFAYANGVRINEAHEKPLNDLAKRERFIHLFHGSKQGIVGDIDIHKSYKYNDLGQGFYLSETLTQSSMFVSDDKKSKVYSFGLNISNLNVFEFEVSDEWLLTVAFNRRLLDEYKDSKKLKKILNKTKNADVIITPIADNRMFDIINEFVESRITIEACQFAIASLDLGKQYVLKTNKAIKNLGFIKEYYLCQDELKDYRFARNKMQNERMNEIKHFRSKYKNGHYIEEIL